MEKETKKISPKVAIVGRPNVGKSSLFNAVLNRKKSLVSKEIGVTRDLVESPFEDESEDIFFNLVDTGGISETADHPFIKETIFFAKDAIKKADIILFVVDGTSPITQDDYALAEMLRKERFDDTILVVNKVDSEKRETEAFEYYSLGFAQTLFVSAAHRIGLGDLKDLIKEKFITLGINATEKNVPNEEEEEEENTNIKCVLLGKPNVGKSSFFNAVIGKNRAIVSPIPGTTRDVLMEEFTFKNKTIEIMDIAGFRRKARIIDDLEKDMIKKGLWAIRRQDIVIILMDVTEEVSEQDKKLVDLAMKEKRALIIGLNKWDLIEEDPKVQEMILDRFTHHLALAHFVPIVPFSVKTGKGINSFLNEIVNVHENLNKKISPREITIFIKQCIKEKPPFSKLGELKLFYGVQITNRPVHFQFFVNNPEIVTPAYEKFLKNSIYKHYKLKGVPIFITFKARH